MTDTPKPVYFCVLSAAIRNMAIPSGEPGHYRKTERDDYLANEFRAEYRAEWRTNSIPLGPDRDRAETVIAALNQAFHYGQVYAARKAKDPRTQTVEVGRMGHINRQEELMP